MKRELRLYNIKPFSINKSYYGGNKGRVKTSEFREWTCNVFHILSQTDNRLALKDIREYFSPEKHCIELCLTASYPKSEFLTKKGSISAKTVDTTNWEKSLVDCIFLPSNYGNQVPYTCENLNLDDKYVTSCISRKRASLDDFYCIDVTISIIDLVPLI